MILKTSRPYFYFLKTIRWQILTVLIVAFVFGPADILIDKYYGWDHPISVPAFLGTAIVFILSFRTAQAYERWWEARKIWGAIVNDSRTWTRMVLNLISDQPPHLEEGKELKRRLIDRQIAWNYILAARLRDQDALEERRHDFSAEDFEYIQSVDNPNQAIMILQTKDLKIALDQKRVRGLHHIELEECLRDLESYLGKVERIKNTHFPVLYDHLILVTIYIFAGFLSLSISKANIFFEGLFSAFIATIFLALEKIASDMQDPFENLPTDTPITAISYTIERGALQMAGETEMPPAPEQGSFYIN